VIVEGVVTTVSSAGVVNIAPMGPLVPDSEEPPRAESLRRFWLRPFRTARTCENLLHHGEGVFHLTDDVLLLARAAVGDPEPPPLLEPATVVRGFVLADCCRFYEFRVVAREERGERACFEVEVVHTASRREFLGFNRARNAVLEAAILATRVHLLPRQQIEEDLARLASPVEKTAGPRERQAFAFLRAYLESVWQQGPTG